MQKPKDHAPSKQERRNTQKQIQKNKKDEQVRNARFFGGTRGAAKIIVYFLEHILLTYIQAVVSLCPDIDVSAAVRNLNLSVDVDVSLTSGICTLEYEHSNT